MPQYNQYVTMPLKTACPIFNKYEIGDENVLVLCKGRYWREEATDVNPLQVGIEVDTIYFDSQESLPREVMAKFADIGSINEFLNERCRDLLAKLQG